MNAEDTASISYRDSRSVFRLGDGRHVQSTKTACIPAYVGPQKVYINTAVVNQDIPLLLSRLSMKKANMQINFEDDTAHALGHMTNLSITRNGQYILPLIRATQLLPQVTQRLSLGQQNITLHLSKESKDQSKSAIAEKLHRQFVHAPAEKLIRLLNNAGSPWWEDDELKTHLRSTVKNCQTCKLYKKLPPTPVVGLPLATHFQQTVTMDLKFYHGWIILYLIDHATRLSVAVQVPSKHPKAILNAILRNWISIYGSADQFLTDNGGEFVNDDFLKLCEAFNIKVKTTGAEAPWSNGMVEHHNLVLPEMLNKILEDTKCPFDIALQWYVNAKNSLHNVQGFCLTNWL